MPAIENLYINYTLSSHNSFIKGTPLIQSLKNRLFTFFYTFYNDEKRFAINSNFIYVKNIKSIGVENTISNNLTFSNYLYINNSENYNATISLVNYLKKIKLATKIETNQSWNFIPLKVNSSELTLSQGHIANYKFSGTTYFKLPINFDFGVDFNYYSSKFNEIYSQTKNSNYFLKSTLNLSKKWIIESNNNFYFLNQNNYKFINAIISYNPSESKLSYRIIANNILNENSYRIKSINNYITYNFETKLVPRYLLLVAKFRF